MKDTGLLLERMREQDLVHLLEDKIEMLGFTREWVANPADPTQVTRTEAKVYMPYGIANDTGEPEEIRVTMTRDWATTIAIGCDTGRCDLIWVPQDETWSEIWHVGGGQGLDILHAILTDGDFPPLED